MKFGICFNVDYYSEIHGSPADYYNYMLNLCVLIEDLGYDSAWFSEHHSGPYSFGNPALMIAQAADRTKRLKLGTGVSLLPLHHPIVLSEEYAMLDQLSGGRLEYGIGRGYLQHEYPWLNVPTSESAGRYREAIDFIIKAWTSREPIAFDGEFFKVDRYQPFPAVVQDPMPRIFCSAVSPESYTYAGSKNLDIGVAIFIPGIEALPANIANYEATLAASGFARSNREIMGITQMYCAEDEAEALAGGKKYAENYYRFFAKLMSEHSVGPNPAAEHMRTVDALSLNANNQTLFGSPSSLIEKIERMRAELKIDYLQLEVAQGGCTPEDAVKALRVFGEKVIPHFKARSARRPTASSTAGSEPVSA